ncbi:MAG: hypothetical protein ACOCQD_04810 [archaeon]
MIRMIIVFLFSIVTLGIFSIDVQFKDGLRITTVGWPEKISRSLKKIRK